MYKSTLLKAQVVQPGSHTASEEPAALELAVRPTYWHIPSALGAYPETQTSHLRMVPEPVAVVPVAVVVVAAVCWAYSTWHPTQFSVQFTHCWLKGL